MASSPAETLAWIGLGANLGDRLATLRRAAGELGALGRVTARSSVWETESVGGAGGFPFLNAVVALATGREPELLLDELLAIERRHGRMRPAGPAGGTAAPRTLDLDLLLVADRVIDTPRLTVPHPRLHQRAFVLAPLAEIAPALEHPLLHRSMNALLADLSPGPWVRRLDVTL